VKQVVALVAAVVMVVVALQVRSAIEDGDSGSTGSARLLCATEVAAACQILGESTDVDIVTEDAGATYLRLIDDTTDPDDVGFDGWLVPSPWPQLVIDARERAQLPALLDRPGERIARSPLVAGLRRDRAAVLEDTAECGGTITWRCLGDVAGRAWGDIGGSDAWGVVRAGHPSPDVSATGLLVLGQAATQFFGNSEFSRVDLETDAFQRWLRALEGSGPPPPFEPLLARGFTGYDVVGTTEAEAGPVLARASSDRREQTHLVYFDEVATVDVVLATAAGSRDKDDVRSDATGGDARSALAETGWRVEGEARADGVRDRPRLPDGTGLPDAGVLEALRETWELVT
jgi:hypothetical protein